MSLSINVISWRHSFGGSSRDHEAWSEFLHGQFRQHERGSLAGMQKVFAYTKEGEPHTLQSVEMERGKVLIMFDATMDGSKDAGDYFEGRVDVRGNRLELKYLPILETDNVYSIKDMSGDLVGAQVAEKDGGYYVTINSNISKQQLTDRRRAYLGDLFTKVFKKIEDIELEKSSWNNEDNRDTLIKEFAQNMRQEIGQNQQRLERSLREATDKVESHRSRLANAIRDFNHFTKQLELAQGGFDSLLDKLIKEIELINQHEVTTNVSIQEGVISVTTDDIYMYDDNNNRYYLGKMLIKITLGRADVRFYNTNNPREGYWSSEDPHPHVDGRSGNPCLGNVSATIAELSAQNELYALFLMGVSYLESANLDDPAGRKVYNWDKVDEEGSIIQEGRGNHDHDEEDSHCEVCGRDLPDEEMYGTAYNTVDNGEVGDPTYICNDCRDEEYYYSERLEEVIHHTQDDGEGEEE